jgi:hypothetical protein
MWQLGGRPAAHEDLLEVDVLRGILLRVRARPRVPSLAPRRWQAVRRVSLGFRLLIGE